MNAWILARDVEALAAHVHMGPEERDLARRLSSAYSYPISSHVFGPEGDLRKTFPGNSMFEGAVYLEFLEESLQAH
ncbi:MAG: hypothetical protein AAGB93_22340 [Planctomycetota bacterium]